MDPLIKTIFHIASPLLAITNPTQYQHVKGISEAIGSDFTITLLANSFAAIDTYCSSAIVRLLTGEVVNVRNTDYFNADAYRNTTYWAKWEKNGK